MCGFVCFFKQKTAYEMRISDWSSDVCSSDLPNKLPDPGRIISVVTPASRAVSKPGSCGQTECSTQTCAVLGSVSSLTSLCASTVSGFDQAPRCEWASITPGVIHLPPASIVRLPEIGRTSCRERMD